MLTLLLALPLCAQLPKAPCTESQARISQGLYSYNQSYKMCKAGVGQIAWWYDHVYTHTWVSRPCVDFLKKYKPSTK